MTDATRFRYISRNFGGYFPTAASYQAYRDFTMQTRPEGTSLRGPHTMHRAYQGLTLTALGLSTQQAAERLRDELRQRATTETSGPFAELRAQLTRRGITNMDDPRVLSTLQRWVGDSRVGPASLALRDLAAPTLEAWQQSIRPTPDADLSDPRQLHAAAVRHGAATRAEPAP